MKQQIEFYFSDSNLIHDKFMSDLIDKDPNGFLHVSEFLRFNKVSKKLDDYTNLSEFKIKLIEISVKNSKKLILSSDRRRVRRKKPWISSLTNILNIKARKRDCMIYIENIPIISNTHELFDIFKQFGEIQ